MKRKRQKTFDQLFTHPVSANIKWRDAVALMEELGAEIEEREGSRVAFLLRGRVMIQHRPHPSPNMDKGAVVAMRQFLAGVGIRPNQERSET